MIWWTRRATWQKALIGAGALVIVLNTATALFAPGSTGDATTAATSSTTPDTSSSTAATTTRPTSPTIGTTTTTTAAGESVDTTTTTVPSTTSTTLAPPPGTGRVTLASVTDGDTVRVRFTNGAVEKVRLVGINTPETGECYAGEATQALTGLLTGTGFTMTTDVSDRDRYDRLLRYLWLDDGTFVNEAMVAGGFALAGDYPPDSRYAGQLAAAQQRAEASGLGLWAPDACGPATAGDLQITFIEYDAPGNDHENLNGEWVEITNRGTATETMSSWVLKDESASHRYTFPSGFTLDAGSSVRVFTGCGSDTSRSLYWCNDAGAVWNNGGDTGFLLDPSGNLVDRFGY